MKLDKCSSVHIFQSGKAILKFPLNSQPNKVMSLDNEQAEELKRQCQDWRVIEADGVFHAVRNPTTEIDFSIPEELDLEGNVIIFGATGSGKSTLLSTIGRSRVAKDLNVMTIESPRTLRIADATHLNNNEDAINTVLLCRPDVVLFDEVRTKEHYKQLKDLSLACPNVIGSFHATDVFEALTRFASFNGQRSYGELATIASILVHVDGGEIVDWYRLETTLSEQLQSEFYVDGERPVTTIYDRDNVEVGWLFYFANDINVVRNQDYEYRRLIDPLIEQEDLIVTAQWVQENHPRLGRCIYDGSHVKYEFISGGIDMYILKDGDWEHVIFDYWKEIPKEVLISLNSVEDRYFGLERRLLHG